MSNLPPSYDYATAPGASSSSSSHTYSKQPHSALSSEERERLQAEGDKDAFNHHGQGSGQGHGYQSDDEPTTDEDLARKLSQQWTKEDMEEREEMDDEERELPDGFVRAYDSKVRRDWLFFSCNISFSSSTC